MTRSPEIWSSLSDQPDFDGFCFALPDDARMEAFLAPILKAEHVQAALQSMARLQTPVPLDEAPALARSLQTRGYRTIVRLPLKNQAALESVHRQLTRLGDGSAPVQLFLSRLSSLEISGGPFASAVRLERSAETLLQDEAACNVERRDPGPASTTQRPIPARLGKSCGPSYLVADNKIG